MVGTGANPDECQGSRADHRNDLAGRTARNWEVEPEEDCRLGGFGADERGQWQEARLSQDEGRACGSAQRAVHVDLNGDEVQPIDPGTVSGIIEEGEGEEGGSDCMYAEVPKDLERNNARQSPVQADGDCLRWTGFSFLFIFMKCLCSTSRSFKQCQNSSNR